MAKDLFHAVVKTALQKDGWTITADPYHLSSGDDDIVLAFHDPFMRQYTGFAVS